MLWATQPGGLELRQEGGETRLLGRFPYNVETVLREAGPGQPELREVFAPKAFALRVERRDRNIRLLAGHDMSRPIAAIGAGSLDLDETEEALTFEARIDPVMAKASYVADLMATIRAGLTIGVSPGFRVASDLPDAETVEPRGAVVLRTVRHALLEEISIVTRPAYPQAQVEARSWTATTPRPQGGNAPLQHREIRQQHLTRWRP